MSCLRLIRWFMGWLSCAPRCLLQLRSWLKPNFSNHWGNWFFAPLFAFLIGYLPVSVFADVPQRYCNGGKTICASTPADTCMAVFQAMYSDEHPQSCGGNTSYFINPEAKPRNPGSDSTSYLCESRGRFKTPACDSNGDFQNWQAWGSNFDVYPDLDFSCPDPGTLYSGSVMSSPIGSGFTDPDGCEIVPNWKPTYCDYPGAESKECVKQDGYKYGSSQEPPPKICKDESGRYLGQVSQNASCPTPQRTRCYNSDGTLAYIVDEGASCPAGTSPDNAPPPAEVTDSDVDPETGETTGEKTKQETETSTVEVTSNPDGSTTTVTTTTRTNGDGSTSTTTVTKTTNPDGSSVTSTETEGSEPASGVNEAGGSGDQSSASGGTNCKAEPSCSGDPLQCYQIKQNWRSACHKDEVVQGFVCGNPDGFVCEGGPIECYSLRLKHEAACIRGDKSAAEKAISDAIANGDIEFDGTDEWGQLNGLDNGELNVSEHFNISSIWTDSGASGTCPSPIAINTNVASFEFDFQPMCDLAGMIRALVILSAMWISGSMLAQALAGTRYTV